MKNRPSIQKVKAHDEFLKLGGHPILDFLNTEMKHQDQFVDHLENTHDVQNFYLEIMQVKVFTESINLRETKIFRARLRELLINQIDGESRQANLKELNQFLAKVDFVSQIKLEQNRELRMYWSSSTEGGAGLRPLILSLVDFLSFAESSRIKKCANGNCTHLFYDSSKSNTRNWCSMKSCGNIMKARAFYQRAKTEKKSKPAKKKS